MKYVYMNHRIKQKKPDGPAIVCQGKMDTVESNRFELIVNDEIIGYVEFHPAGLAECATHDVKAWVEFADFVTVRPIGAHTVTPHLVEPKAVPKEPNKPVTWHLDKD
jgi:hypothetical protein